MKHLANLTVILGVAAGPALAEMHMDSSNLIRTRDITGGNIYSMADPMNDADWDSWEVDAVGSDWNDIGEIEDIILDKSGQVIGVVAEVGGFLDIGDKHVMLPIADVRLTPVDDRTYSVVTRLSEEQLEEMEAVGEAWWN